jgi:hypothetical protein
MRIETSKPHSNMSVYKCHNGVCPDYGKEVVTMHYRAYRLATGRSPTCGTCGNVLTWEKNVE